MQNPIYRECMRNHAAKLGSYAIDGCREYSPSVTGPDLCAACGCHRSYHRRIDLETPAAVKTHACIPYTSLRRVKQLARQIQQRQEEQPPAAAAAAATAEEEDEEEDEYDEEEEEGEEEGIRREERRRRRRKSKFTAEQREAMREYAERLGWTLRDKRGRREEIRMFCDAIGVSRYLFKTWVNNNKRFYSVS